MTNLIWGNYGSNVTEADIKQSHHGHHHVHRHDHHHDHHDHLNDEGSGAPSSVGVDPHGGPAAPTEEVLASWRKSLEQVIIKTFRIIIMINLISMHQYHYDVHDHHYHHIVSSSTFLSLC